MRTVMEAILEAGLYAPSAGGGQRPLFVVCQDRELNLLLGKNKRAHSQPRMAKRHKKESRPEMSGRLSLCRL